MEAYTLVGKEYEPEDADKQILLDNPPKSDKDWTLSRFSDFKTKLKDHYYIKQFTRCAYCRKKLEGGARYEHIDHIIAKSKKPEWQFEVKNLVIACQN